MLIYPKNISVKDTYKSYALCYFEGVTYKEKKVAL